ncbi:hypothetical protein [Vibrio scophthalmi]|uniref:Uncharacterized protein n=1 Tax=Vibrio scophthalmi LMG 19158 TaxID=870967 RepID=F9RLT7_9VIBR|nr:hypothetical protein [Vibrio scophthalmi]EGU38637.1 hypothetical protein VIS19158_02470 [Vibrio scophthalmi LMG 19158]
MANASSTNIYLEHKGDVFKFLNIKIEDKNDGSVYISLVRDGETEKKLVKTDNGIKHQTPEKPRLKKKRLSYHATGTVLYHDTDISSAYFEPTSNITQVNHIATWSIPTISALDLLNSEPKPKDHVVEWFGNENRATFHILVAPNTYTPEVPHISLRYEGLLSVYAVYLENFDIDSYPEEAFIVMGPIRGLFNSPKFEQKEALIEYHKKITGSSDLILYSPNGAGVSKIITSVPMRVPPRVKIDFLEADYSAEVTKRKEHIIEFKVKDKHGAYVKTPVSILNITLDSEL